jgi:hypothetical protein
MALTAARIAFRGGGRASDTTDATALDWPVPVATVVVVATAFLFRRPAAPDPVEAVPKAAVAAAADRCADRFCRRLSARAAPVSCDGPAPFVPPPAADDDCCCCRCFWMAVLAACFATARSMSSRDALGVLARPRRAAMAASRLARAVATDRSAFETDFGGLVVVVVVFVVVVVLAVPRRVEEDCSWRRRLAIISSDRAHQRQDQWKKKKMIGRAAQRARMRG